jgi:hypothetical protein
MEGLVRLTCSPTSVRSPAGPISARSRASSHAASTAAYLAKQETQSGGV